MSYLSSIAVLARPVPPGCGESKLKDPGNGEADENRRVETVGVTF